MTAKQIIAEIQRFYRIHKRAPNSHEMQSVSTECHRKIGSWRYALWQAGVIPDARKVQLPQLSFRRIGSELDLTEKSRRILERLEREGVLGPKK
jgi:hypothetical protein